MSNTLRKIVDRTGKSYKVDDTKAKYINMYSSDMPTKYNHKKMKPYSPIQQEYGTGRYRRGSHYGYGTGQYMGNTRIGTKLEIANANRSLKKSVRQSHKLEIRKELQYEKEN